jgi:hypothetical protein
MTTSIQPPATGNTTDHIEMVGWLTIANNALNLLLTLALLVVAGAAGLFSLVLADDLDWLIALVAVGAFVLFMTGAGVVSLAGIIAGWYLMQRRNWARIVVLVLAFPQLLNFPIGTAIGGYTIWALLIDEPTKAEFGQAGSPR